MIFINYRNENGFLINLYFEGYIKVENESSSNNRYTLRGKIK